MRFKRHTGIHFHNIAEAASMVIQLCLAGATGWAGSELARAIAKTEDLAPVAAVSRKHAGRALAEVMGQPRLTCRVYPSATEALAHPCAAFVEYTKPDQRPTIRHDSGNSARPYVDGALPAIRKVSTLLGVHGGLDSVLDL